MLIKVKEASETWDTEYCNMLIKAKEASDVQSLKDEWIDGWVCYGLMNVWDFLLMDD